MKNLGLKSVNTVLFLPDTQRITCRLSQISRNVRLACGFYVETAENLYVLHGMWAEESGFE